MAKILRVTRSRVVLIDECGYDVCRVATLRRYLLALTHAESPGTCPHGRPTMIHLTADAIAREFRRK